jgi:hypothetical protein
MRYQGLKREPDGRSHRQTGMQRPLALPLTALACCAVVVLSGCASGAAPAARVQVPPPALVASVDSPASVAPPPVASVAKFRWSALASSSTG